MEFILQSVLPVVLTLTGIALFALFAVYAERKVSAFIQDRMGPMEVGPYGLLQTLADIIKLVSKENIVHSQADGLLFGLAPLVVFVAVFAGFAVVPWGPAAGHHVLHAGVLYLLAVVSIDVIGLLMAGWGSNSKYALFGAVRSVAQIISYEIPAGLAILSVVALYGTLNLNDIALQQSGFAAEPVWFFGWNVQPVGGVVGWSVVRYPHLLVVWCVFFIATLAETNRAPFDLPEAESELVAGFLTEYSGFRFAVLMLAEYAYMLLVALLGVVLFFGGWSSPLPNLAWAPLPANPTTWDLWRTGHWALATSVGGWAPVWLLGKACLWILLMMWVRWTLPRLRPDQLMTLCWKVLTPLGLGLFLVSVVWKLVERSLTL